MSAAVLDPFVETPPPPAAGPPELRDGMRLDRREFHRRYEAICETDPDFRAELIEGVVSITRQASRTRTHARFTFLVRNWLAEYEKRTPTVIGRADATTALGELAQPEPDTQLRDRAEDDADDAATVTGAPGLVIEVSDSTRLTDLARNGGITRARACRNTSWSTSPAPRAVVRAGRGRRVR